jgi:hypothetical protein
VESKIIPFRWEKASYIDSLAYISDENDAYVVVGNVCIFIIVLQFRHYLNPSSFKSKLNQQSSHRLFTRRCCRLPVLIHERTYTISVSFNYFGPSILSTFIVQTIIVIHNKVVFLMAHAQ